MIKAQLDLSGWTRKFNRIGVAVRQAPDVQLHAGAQQDKLDKAIERGDSITWSKAAMPAANRLMAAGVARIANSGGTSLTSTMNEIGKMLAEDVRGQILSGKIKGPPRSPSTIARKGHNRNDMDTGRLAGAITYRLVRR